MRFFLAWTDSCEEWKFCHMPFAIQDNIYANNHKLYSFHAPGTSGGSGYPCIESNVQFTRSGSLG